MANYLDKQGLSRYNSGMVQKLKSIFALHGETATDAQVATAVTSWLNTNVDPVGSAVVVDNTLLIEGAAADAKKTGEEVTDLKNALNDTEVLLDVPIKSGKLYGYVTPGSQYSISDNANSYYTDLIDVSKLVGGTLKIQMSAVGTGSRCFGFCDSNGIVKNILYSSDSNQFELDPVTGLYVCETEISDVRFFFSSSKVSVKILISAIQKNETDIEEVKVQNDITNQALENGSADYSPVYTNRSMNDTTGIQSDTAPKIASTPNLYFVPIHCNVSVSNYSATDYSAKVYCYDDDKDYLGVLRTVAVVPNENLSLLTGTRYIRFLVLRKDNTNITPQEAAQAITFTAVYDGRVKDLEDTVDAVEVSIGAIEDSIDEIEDKLAHEITSDLIPSIPYKVFRTSKGYDAERPNITDDFYSVYVDSANGNDSNDGTSGHPVKTLSRAVYLARVQMDNNSKDTVIHVADNSVFYYDDIPDNYSVSKSFAIVAPSKATVFAGKKPTFTQSGNHYISESLTSYTPIGVIDAGVLDDYGLFAPLSKVDSESLVDSTPGSYYIDTTNKIAYVRPFASSSISNVVVIFSNKYAMNPSTSGFTRSSFVYLKNITFVGNSTATGRAAATEGETIVRTIYVDGCTFEHGFSNNVVSFNDYDYTYVVDSKSGYGKYDCYNYHFTRKPTPTSAVVVEVNDISKEAGYYNSLSGYSDNLTTCHDGANILRCGSHGYNANGGMCADVDGCYSVCIDCTFANTSYAETGGVNRAPYYFANSVSGPRNAKSILQNCFGYDSRNNKMVDAVDLLLSGNNSGGTISATEIRVNKELI